MGDWVSPIFKYLILMRLVRAELLLSQRGSKGGYMLARKPGAIPVAEIINAIKGYPMGLTECSCISGLCARAVVLLRPRQLTTVEAV